MQRTHQFDDAMDSRPTVSVLLPNYNHATFLSRALKALAHQSIQADEILLVDDGSSDDSLIVAQTFLPVLPQLRIIRNALNAGVNTSLNQALSMARGDYVISTAADDWLDPAFIEEMLDALSIAPGAKLIVSRYREHIEADDRFVEHGPDSELGQWYLRGFAQSFDPGEFNALLKRGFVWLPINGALLHREAFLGIGGYDEALRWHSDWFATYAIALRHGFVAIPTAISNFRVASGTYSAGLHQASLQREVCRAIFGKMNEPAFRDVGERIRQHPGAISPFIHHMMTGLAFRPAAWPWLLKLSIWWMNEARLGRRPGFIRNRSKARGLRTSPSLDEGAHDEGRPAPR